MREQIVQFKFLLLKHQRIHSVRMESQVAVTQERQSVFVRLLLCMLQHRVLAVLGRKAANVNLLRPEPFVQVVVFAAPAVKHIRHAVDANVIVSLDGNGSAEQSSVRQMEPKLIQCRAHVTRLFGAGVQMSQPHRHQINVMEYQTGIIVTRRVDGSDVEQFGSIERFGVELLDYEYSVVYVLLA